MKGVDFVRACADGSLTMEQIEYILKDPMNRIVDDKGRTALGAAAQAGHGRVVKELLQKGADPNVCDECDLAAIHHAAQEGHVDVVQELLNHGAKANIEKALEMAVDFGHVEVVKVLIKDGRAKVNPERNYKGSVLNLASEEGMDDIVSVLLDNGANVDNQGYLGFTPLCSAARWGHDEIVRVVLQHGAKCNVPNEDGNTALLYASDSGNCSIVQQLLERDADPDSRNVYDGLTALHVAVLGGHSNVVLQLLSAGADHSLCCSMGKSALHMAFFHLKNGNSPLDHYFETYRPLSASDLAFKKKREVVLDLVQKLVEKGARLDAQDDRGNTPLHEAFMSGMWRVSKYLMEKDGDGALQLALNKQGLTPLEAAARSGASLTFLFKILQHTGGIILHRRTKTTAKKIT